MDVVVSVLTLLAGIGVFMIGMHMMSEGLERSAGKGMKSLFNHLTGNRFAGVGVGALVTVIVNSSAATTVMAIGFVNAGVMTLTQAAAIIMGANIGTTATGFIISLGSLNINLYASALAFVGVMMTFFKSDNVKKIGGILCGLGLMFVGLNSMSGAFSGDSPIKEIMASALSAIDFPLLLILVGMAFTALIQSSTATTAIVITLTGAGAMTVSSGLFVILGTNIGTCITALIASVGTSTNSRRTAFFHLLFNVIGSVVFAAVIWIFEDQVVALMSNLGDPQWQIAWFHFAFNLITTVILLPFINQFVKITELVVRDKPAAAPDDGFKLKYVDDRLLQTPPIAVAQVAKEIVYIAGVAKQNFSAAVDAVLTLDDSCAEEVDENERCINYTYHMIAKYLIELAGNSLSTSDEKLVGAYHHVISDIERIGDYSVNFVEQTDKMKKLGISFSDVAVTELRQMYNKVSEMFDLSLEIFTTRNYALLDGLARIEDEVDQMKEELGVSHIERLNAGECAVERGSYFFSMISALERIADHLINVAFSIKNPTGSQSKRAEINEG